MLDEYLNAKDDKGKTPIFLALFIGHFHHVALLAEYGADLTQVVRAKAYCRHFPHFLHLVAGFGSSKAVRNVLSKCQDLNMNVNAILNESCDTFGNTPLAYALERPGCTFELVKLLLTDENIAKVDKQGFNPLQEFFDGVADPVVNAINLRISLYSSRGVGFSENVLIDKICARSDWDGQMLDDIYQLLVKAWEDSGQNVPYEIQDKYQKFSKLFGKD